MANRIAGITVEINGDTTKLTKALDGTNKSIKSTQSELRDVEKLLKLDPKNVTLLKQKQELLTKAIKDTSDKLKVLKNAQKDMDKNGVDKNSEQYRGLQREIIATTQELKKMEDNAADATDALADFADKGLKGVGAVVGATAGALTAAAEGTRDYREEQGKLNASFAASNKSAETAEKTYKSLFRVIGESDQSVEAAQQIALLADSEEQVAKWASLASGVVGTFGDALQPETFYEAANETLKLGEATGAYVQMLEGTGFSVEEFNAGLAACTSEQEKQEYMLRITENALGAAGSAYEAANKNILEANDAQAAFTDSVADIGNEVEPLLSKTKEIGAELLSKVLPIVMMLMNNLPVVGIVLGGITAALVAFKVASIAATAATQGMTLAQTLLNAVMSANPIGLIILAVTALIAIFVALWNNCEGFRNFWIKLWDNVKIAFAPVIEHIKMSLNNLKIVFQTVFDVVRIIVKTTFENIKIYIQTAINVIKNIIKLAVAIIKGDWSGAWEAIKNIFSSIWSGITKILDNNLNAAKNIVSRIFEGIKATIKNTIDGAKNIVKSGLDAIKTFFDKLKLKFPHIKLPHFKLTGEFSLSPPSVPKLSISWYKKAMDNAMLLNSPTIFGMMGGKLLGGGEAGQEVVAGAATLMKMIEHAMSSILATAMPGNMGGTIRHTGTIRIEGVNNRGEFVAAGNAVLKNLGISGLTRLVMEEIQAETDRRGATY